MWNYPLFCFVKVMFSLYEMDILCKKNLFSTSVEMFAFVNKLFHKYWKRSCHFRSFFSLILSALRVIMVHKRHIIIHKKLKVHICWKWWTKLFYYKYIRSAINICQWNVVLTWFCTVQFDVEVQAEYRWLYMFGYSTSIAILDICL